MNKCYLFFTILVFSSNLLADWKKVIEKSRNTTVRFALWGGSENINKWLDQKVAVDLKKKFNITLERVALTDTEVAIKKLLRDKKKNRKKGSIDLLWVNGENFKTMKEKGLTWKSYLLELPNVKNLNLKDKSISYDFGQKINGLETPWGSAQMVMIYNTNKVKSPPNSVEELRKWVVQNPGRFTYSSPPDFTGSAFLRLLLLNLVDNKDYVSLMDQLDIKKYQELSKTLWSFLLEIRPYLYKKGSYYPESVSKLHQLFSDEIVWMSFDYYPTTAQRMIDKGVFPKHTSTFVFKKGMLANTHYTSIPFNAKNKEAAMVLSNYFLSVEGQSSKLDPKNWGDLSVLDLSKLSTSEQKIMTGINLGGATLPLKDLVKVKRAELPAGYVPLLEKDWKKYILRSHDK